MNPFPRAIAFLRTAPREVRVRWLAALVALLVVVPAGLYYAVYVYVPPHTLILRDDGWHPRTLTVKVGDTVTFKSERGKYFWPASDFHPTHALYPKFDPKQPIAPESSWSFTFDEAGTYPFHDHLAAYFFGIIRVTDASGKVVDNCMAHGRLECWQTQLFLTLAQKGLAATYDEVGHLYKTDPAFATSCHYLAHNIGLASYQFYRTDPSSILSPNAISCAGGFYHGFMEGFLGATGDPKAAAQVCDTIGKKIGDQAPDARLQCYHGIGHGAIETYLATSGQLESPEQMAAGALAMCEKASDGKGERYRCASGIFNGMANFYIDNQFGFSLTTSNPVTVCSHQKDVYKESCYGNMNAVFKWEAHNDLAKAGATIITIPDVKNRISALQYLAALFAMDHLSDTSYASTVTACHTLPVPYSTECITGFAHGLMEHGVPGEEYKQALAMCGEPGLTAPERAACYSQIVGTLQGWYSKEKTAAICAALSPDVQQYCPK